jgi:hypothetical protein
MLALTLSDNLNNSGITGQIAGSDSSSVNTVYVAPLSGSPLVWTSIATRTGDGTVALPVPAGYYFAYVAGAVTGAAALSPPVLGNASIAQLSMQDQCELAIQAKIQTLALVSISPPLPAVPPSHVYRFDTPMSDELLPLVQTPCVIVCPANAAESIDAVVNARDDIGFRISVVVLAQVGNHRQQGLAVNLKRWRESCFRALRFQRLPNVSMVQTVIPEPQVILAWQPPDYGWCFSAITFRCIARDQRGI